MSLKEASTGEVPIPLNFDMVQSVGQVSIIYKHPEIVGGKWFIFSGFRLDQNYVTTQQIIANSVVIPLIGSSSAQLTNNNRAGTMTFSVSRLGVSEEKNSTLWTEKNSGPTIKGETVEDVSGYKVMDLVSVAQAQQSIPYGDGIGATIQIACALNGYVLCYKFVKCTIATCAPLIIEGNDLPMYQIVYNYARWVQLDNLQTTD